MSDIGYPPGSRQIYHSFDECQTEDLWTRGGEVFMTIGFITRPAIIIQNVRTGEQETHVIDSRNFSEFQHYKRET